MKHNYEISPAEAAKRIQDAADAKLGAALDPIVHILQAIVNIDAGTVKKLQALNMISPLGADEFEAILEALTGHHPLPTFLGASGPSRDKPVDREAIKAAIRRELEEDLKRQLAAATAQGKKDGANEFMRSAQYRAALEDAKEAGRQDASTSAADIDAAVRKAVADYKRSPEYRKVLEDAKQAGRQEAGTSADAIDAAVQQALADYKRSPEYRKALEDAKQAGRQEAGQATADQLAAAKAQGAREVEQANDMQLAAARREAVADFRRENGLDDAWMTLIAEVMGIADDDERNARLRDVSVAARGYLTFEMRQALRRIASNVVGHNNRHANTVRGWLGGNDQILRFALEDMPQPGAGS